MEPIPHRKPTQGKRKLVEKTLNLNSVGRHFVESIKAIEETQAEVPAGQATLTREERPSTDVRFRASIRGWSNGAHLVRAESLLAMQDTPMTAALQNNKDILLIPKVWWPNKTESLDPEDPGWWYTITKAIKFRECRMCDRRRGDDLDKETKAYLNRTFRGSKESFQNHAKLKRGRTEMDKAGMPSEQRKTITQRELRPRMRDDRSKSINEEEELDAIFQPEDTQGYAPLRTREEQGQKQEDRTSFSLQRN